MTVYVNWYHNTLEGELLSELFLGMRQVRITLDGHRVVSLFAPSHVYPTLAEATTALAGSASESPSAVTVPAAAPVPVASPAGSSSLSGSASESPTSLSAFKSSHWDHDHNHLRVDALDEFYQLWRIAHGGSRYIAAVDPAAPGADHTSVRILPQAPPPLPLRAAPVPTASPAGSSAFAGSASESRPAKPTRRQLRSTSTIRFQDSVQTSIFDLL